MTGRVNNIHAGFFIYLENEEDQLMLPSVNLNQ
jgi:hypothetical protein